MKLHPLLEEQTAVMVFRTPVSESPSADEFQRSAGQALSAMHLGFENEKIVLKPNVTIGEQYADPDSGITTHPEFVRGLVEHAQGVGAGTIHILEDPKNSDTNEPRTWRGTGYETVAAATGARLRCPVTYNCVRRAVPDALANTTLNVSRLAVSPETVLINVPKFKTHNLAITTLCMKNLMGAVSARERHYCRQAWDEIPEELKSEDRARTDILDRQLHERWQEGLAKRLVDTARVIQPQLNIVEGIVGRDGTGFRRGTNYPLGLVVAGINMVAVDSVASYIMGFDPQRIIYLNTAAAAGLGTNNVDRLNIYTVDAGELVACREPEDLRVTPHFDVISSLWGTSTQVVASYRSEPATLISH